MSAFSDALTAADPQLFDIFGDPCIYDDGKGNEVATLVVIDKNVEVMSAFDTQMPALRNVASLLKSQVPEPKRGHQITVGADIYVVDRINTDDGHVLTVLLQ